MSTNKHATIRYLALDKCFRNPGKKYFKEDLISACNDALFNYNKNQKGVEKRTIFDDTKFMECSKRVVKECTILILFAVVNCELKFLLFILGKNLKVPEIIAILNEIKSKTKNIIKYFSHLLHIDCKHGNHICLIRLNIFFYD